QPRGFQKGPKASPSLPDTGASLPPGLEWRQLSSTRGGPHSPHPKNQSSFGSCHRRPPPGPPRSIHRAPAVATLRAARGVTGGDGAPGGGCGSKAPQGCGPAPLPGNSNAPRERGGGRTPPGDCADPRRRPPRAPPHAHAPSPSPRRRRRRRRRRLPLRRAPGGRRRAPKRARHPSPPRRHRPPPHTPPSAMFAAAGRGALRAAGRAEGPSRQAPGSSPRLAPRPPATVGLAFRADEAFEALRIGPFSSPPELPDVMKPQDSGSSASQQAVQGEGPGPTPSAPQ
uniref:Uncharacterized protein n=1 Tax=Canis lupus familiaris TaxID=9615 RepID=A0A8I3N2M5_CANLF